MPLTLAPNTVELRRGQRATDVTPVKTGVQSSVENAKELDSGVRRNDGVKDLVLLVLNSTALTLALSHKGRGEGRNLAPSSVGWLRASVLYVH